MKTKLYLLPILTALAGCHSAAHFSGGQAIELDAQTRLQVRVEGVQTYPTPDEFTGVSRPRPGEPIHRVLKGADGGILFAYDLEVGVGAKAGSYRFLLKPSKQLPTFRTNREVLVNSRADVVRVELMRQPETGRKVEDVFELAAPEANTFSATLGDVGKHVIAVHNRIFYFFHGEHH